MFMIGFANTPDEVASIFAAIRFTGMETSILFLNGGDSWVETQVQGTSPCRPLNITGLFRLFQSDQDWEDGSKVLGARTSIALEQ
jgi:hypothetical protein